MAGSSPTSSGVYGASSPTRPSLPCIPQTLLDPSLFYPVSLREWDSWTGPLLYTRSSHTPTKLDWYGGGSISQFTLRLQWNECSVARRKECQIDLLIRWCLILEFPNPRWGMVANIQTLAVIRGWDTCVWILNLNRRGLLPLEQEEQMGVSDLF